MFIHLAENGTRTGPHSIWSVRERLQRGELDPGTLGWHEGVANWMAVADLPAIDWHGKTTAATPPPLKREPADSGAQPDTPPPEAHDPADDADEDLGPEEAMDPGTLLSSGVVATLSPRPWARLWARIFDLVLWTFLVVVVLSFTEEGLRTLINNPWLAISVNLLYLFAEALLISIFGTTPGKALLGLYVVPREPGAAGIPLGVAMSRTFLVYALGCALLVNPYFTAGAWIFHYIGLMKHGSSFWDRKVGTAVAAVPMHLARLVIYAALFFGMTLAVGKIAGEDWEQIVKDLEAMRSAEKISPLE